MRFIALLLISFAFAATAQAQSFNPYTLTPVNGAFNGPSPTGGPLPTDLVLLNRFVPSCGCFSTTGLALADFASAADIQSVNARIDQAFQQIDHGITAAVSLPSVFMPSAPGRTSWAVNAGTFSGDVGAGISLAHRLPVNVPIAVTASYAYGGGSANVARFGFMGEF
jgi:hypothetical protein